MLFSAVLKDHSLLKTLNRVAPSAQASALIRMK
jgi:hypothetical protein